MTKSSVSKSTSKLNLTRRQIEIFQKIILVGNEMSDALSALDKMMLLPKDSSKLIRKWQDLMIRLVNLLI
ncbi:MAG: hypothetical protein H0U71_09585 [Gammaproteobacteria bacterium]|nr:hypothetical protein [Gammaproteobacteria bacterium]